MTTFQEGLRKRNKEIEELIQSGYSYKEVAFCVNLTYNSVLFICRKNGIVPPKKLLKWNRDNFDRNYEIIEMIKNGSSYTEVADKFQLTRQRIQQIASEIRLSSKALKADKYKKIVKELSEEMQNQAEQGVRKIKISKDYRLQTLIRHGLPNVNSLKRKRNKEIIKLYKQGLSAKEIVEKGVLAIKDINRIYKIIGEANCQRTPKLIRAEKGHINENKRILKMIKNMRQKKKTCPEIADYLNKKGYRTITNQPFSKAMVSAKYLQSLKCIK